MATSVPEPSLPELLRLKVHMEVGADYFTFGIFLLNDQNGNRIRNFERECQGNPESVMLKILQEWLKGKGMPVTWESLVQTLRDIDLAVLADKIQESKIPAGVPPSPPPVVAVQQPIHPPEPRSDILDTPVSDEDVATIAGKYLTQWEELSPYLGLTHPQEIIIRRTFMDYSDQKREALRRWKEIKGLAATYRALITAAIDASNMELVDNVKAMLKTREKSSVLPTSEAPLPQPPLQASAVNMSRSLDDTPTLPKILFFETSEGRKVKILEEIGSRYQDFGMLLLDDELGAVTEYIALAKQNNVAEINREILSRWVEKEGKLPVTWATLIGVLEDIGRSGLAQKFKDNLK